MSYFSNWFNKTVGGPTPSTSVIPSIPSSGKKRRHSEMEDRTLPTHALPHYPRAPSPVPTIIIDEEQSEKVKRIKKMGIKVRDFVEEVRASPTPEVYRLAVHDLANWDAYLRKRHQRPFRERGLALGLTGGHGKVLRRLLAMGWITEEERERNFYPEDTAALAAYDNSPSAQYPWRISRGLEKPSPLDRRDNWRSKFLPREDDIPEALIFSSTPITDEDEVEHRNKRTKVDEPPSTPVTPPHQPLMSNARRGALSRTKTMATLF